MKASIEAMINEFAIRGLEAQDHELFMRRVANAMNGHPKECLFYGRITKFNLKDVKSISELWENARKNIWNETARNSAEMTEYNVSLDDNGTALCIVFKYTYVDGERTRNCDTSITIRQDNPLIDMFDIEID